MTGLEPGQELPALSYRVTRADLRAYADASGDHNPIHLDDDAARAAGLDGVVAHGMYTMALAARAVAEWTDDAEVLELGGKFVRPVLVPAGGTGARVDVTGTVDTVEDGQARLALQVSCAGQRVLGNPRAVVRV